MVLTALTWYIRKQFGDQQMQRWYRRCSDSAMAFIGINPVKRLAQRAFVQTESGDTFYCVWEFPDCPNHMCEGLCYCMSCEGYGAWGEYGPCNCIAYGDRYDNRDEDPNDYRYAFHKIPLSVIWPHLDERERVDAYDVDPVFVFSVMPNADQWYFPARGAINEADGKNAAKNARRMRREK